VRFIVAVRGLGCGVLAALALASATTLGCTTRTRNDVYSEALAARHYAKTVECKLVYDPERGGNLLSGRDVSRCLDANKKALVLFEEAKQLGMDGRTFEVDLDVQREDVQQLEEMLIMVRRMEVDAPVSP
jgi:hypothetical protein